jgi:hypothetical protein
VENVEKVPEALHRMKYSDQHPVENLWKTRGGFPQGVNNLKEIHRSLKFSTGFPQVFHRVFHRG